MKRNIKARLRALEGQWKSGNLRHIILTFDGYQAPSEEKLEACPFYNKDVKGKKGHGAIISVLCCDDCEAGCNKPSEGLKGLYDETAGQ